MKDLFLIYVHEVGVDSKGNNIYEFIFSDTTEEIDGNEWDFVPAVAANPSVPNERFIKEIGTLTTNKIKFDVIQKSSVFCVWDGIDSIVSLCFENIDSYEVYPKKRLGFMFGETLQEVKDKLYEKDLILELKYEKKQKNIN